MLKWLGIIKGFRYYWRWKSRRRGRPRIDPGIRRMCRANPLWGAPRIHGELLKLGIEVSEATVSKYMIKRRGPPSQTHPVELRRLLPQRENAFILGKGCA